ncbi:unnamed protein product [Rodentolepis nana]|uniref:JmjC domain-containing protein n=1 Tax=Rodentolepis nana TaxID=102285 RepID=A0A0R3T678_RODNA|nr:unnamed protein product [Rodentolepis nana]
MCAVNINVDPGDCEWFAVPEQYWGSIHHLTEHQGLDFLTSSWWPDVEELRQEGIPVYRFLQKPGDLVWFNAGTVFWGQALGWSTLLRTMVNSQIILDFLEQLRIPVKRHGKKPDEIAHNCQDCEIEVFNILFATTQDKRSEVRCFSCARRNDPSLQSFSVLSEYYMSELATIYDNFQTNTVRIFTHSSNLFRILYV